MTLTDDELSAWARDVAHEQVLKEDRIPLLPETTVEAMRETLAEGEANGETIEQLKARVAAVFDADHSKK